MTTGDDTKDSRRSPEYVTTVRRIETYCLRPETGLRNRHRHDARLLMVAGRSLPIMTQLYDKKGILELLHRRAAGESFGWTKPLA